MIQIIIGDPRRGKQTVQIQGHSTLGKKGENLLCAGVSTLAQALVLAMEKILFIQLQTKRSEGLLEFHIPADLKTEQKQGTELLLNMFVLTLNNLKEQFPSEIQMTIKKSAHQFTRLNLP